MNLRDLKKTALAIALPVVVIATTTTAGAMPVPYLELPKLVKASTLIVVGVAGLPTTAANKDGSLKCKWLLKSNRALKGKPPSGPSLTVESILEPGIPPFSGTYPAIFFLKEKKNKIYDAIDPFHMALPAAGPNGSIAKPSGDSLKDVAMELASVLRMPPDALKTVMIERHCAFISYPDGKHIETDIADDVYSEVAQALNSVPKAVVDEELSAIADTTEQAVNQRLWVNNVLIHIGDWQHLPDLTELLLDPPAGALRPVRELASAFERVAPKDEARIPVMTVLLASKDVWVRREAVHALRTIGGKSVIKPLAVKALSDRDAEVRWYAMAGLSEAYNQPNLFPDHPSKWVNGKYVDYAPSASIVNSWKNLARQFYTPR